MATDNSSLRIILADDHSIVRNGLELLIEETEIPTEIHHASSLRETLEKTANLKPQILILDAQFPDGNCITRLQELKQSAPGCRIMIFSSFDENTYALKYIEAGADGYLSKLSEENEIKAALISMIEYGEYYSAKTQNLLRQSVKDHSLINPLQQLSEREMEIAEFYVKGFGNLEIANALNLKQNTVSTLKKRIFEKLKIDNLVELIELMRIHHSF